MLGFFFGFLFLSFCALFLAMPTARQSLVNLTSACGFQTASLSSDGVS
jgi:hypothetical protein